MSLSSWVLMVEPWQELGGSSLSKPPVVLPLENEPVRHFNHIYSAVNLVFLDLFPGRELLETDVQVCTRSNFIPRVEEYARRCRQELFDLLPEDEKARIGYEQCIRYFFKEISPWRVNAFYSSFTNEAVVLDQWAIDTAKSSMHELSHRIFGVESNLKGIDGVMSNISADEQLAMDAGRITKWKLESMYQGQAFDDYQLRVEEFKRSFDQALVEARSYSHEKRVQEVILHASTIPTPKGNILFSKSR